MDYLKLKGHNFTATEILSVSTHIICTLYNLCAILLSTAEDLHNIRCSASLYCKQGNTFLQLNTNLTNASTSLSVLPLSNLMIPRFQMSMTSLLFGPEVVANPTFGSVIFLSMCQPSNDLSLPGV